MNTGKKHVARPYATNGKRVREHIVHEMLSITRHMRHPQWEKAHNYNNYKTKWQRIQ
jgi:hypothetical protein